MYAYMLRFRFEASSSQIHIHRLYILTMYKFSLFTVDLIEFLAEFCEILFNQYSNVLC
jgi:hypothetical protein